MRDSIEEFMARRARKAEDFARDAEAAAHDAYGKAIRAGRDLALATPSEVMTYGAGLLKSRTPTAPPSGLPIKRVAPAPQRADSPNVLSGPHEAALQADTAVRGATNLFTFGGADHLEAGWSALTQPGGLAGWRQRYDADFAEEKARNQYDAVHRQVAQGLGQLGGIGAGLALTGPMEGALAAAPRLAGAAARTSREATAILAGGGAMGWGAQAVSDLATRRQSSWGDNAGAILGGVAGAAALPLGPARAAAADGTVTSAAQDLFNGRAVSLEHAGESALAGNVIGGLAGLGGRAGSNSLPPRLKGKLGETLGAIRSKVNGQPREIGPKMRDTPDKAPPKFYWYPDGRAGDVRFEDKFGISAGLSPNQRRAREILGPLFHLNSFLPADIGKAASVPAGASAAHVVGQEPDQ